LVLDDGENLVESGAILDEVDQMVVPERRLIPSDRSLRRHVVQTAAIALACAEKAQWAFYEDRVRPPGKVHMPWIEHNDAQVLGGLQQLNAAAAKLPDSGWIAGTPTISQADITAAAACSFAALARPKLQLAERFPQLFRFVERCEELPAFLDAPIPAGARLAGLLCEPFVH
jgi:glutathione S-transferase